jgi:hypothetical protein
MALWTINHNSELQHSQPLDPLNMGITGCSQVDEELLAMGVKGLGLGIRMMARVQD